MVVVYNVLYTPDALRFAFCDVRLFIYFHVIENIMMLSNTHMKILGKLIK